MSEDTTTDEDVERAAEQSYISITTADAYNEMLAEESAKQGTYTDAQLKEARADATSASLKVLEKMTENNTLIESDKAVLSEYFDVIMDSSDITDPTEFPKIQTAFDKLSPDGQAKMKNLAEVSAKLITDKTTSAIESLDPGKGKVFTSLMDKVKQLGSKVFEQGKLSSEAFSNWLKGTEEIEQNLEDNTKLKEKIIADKGKSFWETYKTTIMFITILGAGVGALSLYIKIWMDSHTGCFMWYSGDKTKLSCSQWYKDNGKSKCTCGTATTPAQDPDCGTNFSIDSDECTAPFCLGRPCKNNKPAPAPATVPNQSGNTACDILYGHRLMCTTGSLADKGSVSYGWQEVTPLQALASIPSAIGTLIKDIDGGIGDIIKSVIKWVVIVALICVGLFILYAIAKVVLRKLNEEHKPANTSAHKNAFKY